MDLLTDTDRHFKEHVMAKPRLFLLDGAAVAYRGHFAFIKNPRITTQGFDTSAIYGFMDTLLMILKKQKPDYFAVVFDSREPTFRHKLYKEYKANREEMPEDLAKGFPYIHKMVKALNLPILVKPGFEADDLIGTMVQRAKKEKIDSVIVSGDKDFMQLIGPGVQMYKPKWPNDWSMADEKDVMEKFGVKPDQVIDVLALMGDASDNVPGVPGIGEKTATILIQEYGTLDNLFKNVEKIQKPKLKESLLKNKAMADLSKELVTIDCEAPIPDRPQDMILGKPDMAELRELCHELEFNRMMSRIEEYAGVPKGSSEEFKLESPEKAERKKRKRRKRNGRSGRRNRAGPSRLPDSLGQVPGSADGRGNPKGPLGSRQSWFGGGGYGNHGPGCPDRGHRRGVPGVEGEGGGFHPL